ncbi:MAG: hypothetical protein N2688_00460 [Burkholderiaceae bacterium]|nr:hypothetical protein [Burkholderiaceae bacterium]
MPIADNFSVASNGDIRYIGPTHGNSGAAYYTVLELHRWLQDLADDQAASGNDLLDISRATPSDKLFDTIITLVNGYNINDATAEYLYGGSIIQDGGNTIYDGIAVIAAPGANVQIVQNGALITNAFWNSTPFGASTPGLNPNVAQGLSHQFMLKVRAGGADIDGRRLLVQTREWGKTFSEFRINGTSRGVNVAALTFADDLNNQTAVGTVAGYSDVTNLSAGYNLIDVDNNTVTEPYYSRWDRGSRSINQFYERMKWLTRRGSTSTLYGLNGELFRGITHEVTVTTPRSGTVGEGVSASWTGGTGQVLARDNGTAATKLWIQLLTGVAPAAGQTITIGAATVTAGTGTPSVERTLSFPFCGQSTGTALIGAYGFALETSDLSVSDKLTDLTGALRTPPNLVTFTVTGLVANEDYVLVGPENGSGGLNTAQFTLNGALTGAAVTSVVVNGSIPADTPATGTIRIQRANGAFTRHAYTSWSGSTFTIGSTDFSTNNAANGAGVYVSYIDQLITTGTTLSFQTTYTSDRALYVRRRDGGVTPTKTFETVATLGAAGGSVAVQRLSDA